MKRAHDDLTWFIPATFMVLLECFAASLLGFLRGLGFKNALLDYFILSATLFVSVSILALLFLLARCAIRRVESPIAQLRADFLAYGSRIALFAAGLCLFILQLVALAWTKSLIPHLTTFWADPYLASFDRMLFGNDPWRYLHAFGELPLIDNIYATWAPVKFLTLLIIFALPASREKSRALLSYFIILLAGGLVGQYILPSGGPIFYERLGHGDDFSTMPVEPVSALASNYLWVVYQSAEAGVGSGISAMPSIHVAMSLWIALVVRTFNRPLGWIAYGYFGLIYFGSVYLGWHYALDGIMGSLVTLSVWWVVGWLIDEAEGRKTKKFSRALRA